MANVKLSNVIRRAQTKVDKDDTDLVFYVGGEHIESENIRVHSRGIIVESTIGPMFYYGFKAGDFLLVSRNPHLKKAGLVDFDGICSEKTFVLETANSDVLLPEFLPFVLQNERFWDYAYRHRHGSTNTFINWSTLANYEFELPDLETQRKLAEVLWSINDTMEAYKNLISATDELVKSQFIGWSKSISRSAYRTLDSICTLITDGTHQPPKFVSCGIPFLLVSNITSNKVTYATDKYITEEMYLELSKRTPVEVGDILLSTVGSYGHPAIVKENRKFSFQRHIAFLKPDHDQVDSVYLHAAILSSDVQKQIDSLVLGVAQKTLNLSAIKKIEIPLPNMAQQKQFAGFVRQSDKSKFELEQALAELTATYKRIITETFV